jgi:hypothetical protein
MKRVKEGECGAYMHEYGTLKREREDGRIMEV